ncbi:hypothetical protein X726_29245 [Mesorhizobium sp. L103C105A0]|nr:hypothetical protein X726_29245 [Mesorhizobium sp. L103C105A0]
MAKATQDRGAVDGRLQRAGDGIGLAHGEGSKQRDDGQRGHHGHHGLPAGMMINQQAERAAENDAEREGAALDRIADRPVLRVEIFGRVAVGGDVLGRHQQAHDKADGKDTGDIGRLDPKHGRDAGDDADLGDDDPAGAMGAGHWPKVIDQRRPQEFQHQRQHQQRHHADGGARHALLAQDRRDRRGKQIARDGLRQIKAGENDEKPQARKPGGRRPVCVAAHLT